jgi:hypothetical protein
MPLDADTIARIDRLKKWCRSRAELRADGEPSIPKLCEKTGKKPQYWSDVLREAKSFGSKVAREVEPQLGMPMLYLEGAGWPFEEVDQERFLRLSDRQKGRVEQAMLEMIEKIEAEQQQSAGTG